MSASLKTTEIVDEHSSDEKAETSKVALEVADMETVEVKI